MTRKNREEDEAIRKDALVGYDSKSARDRYLARLAEAEQAAHELIGHLSTILAGAGRARARIDGGAPVEDVLLSMTAAEHVTRRRDVNGATQDFEGAFQRLRGESVRILVDSGRLTISEMARRGGFSVQMARRLYRAAPTTQGDEG